jgi:hypothetical protein
MAGSPPLATSGADPAELAQLEREIGETAPPPPPPPPAEPEPEDEDELPEVAEQFLEHPEQGIDRLAGLDAQDLADVCQLAFGLAADRRGEHWELGDKSAARLGKWLKRLIDKYGLAWLKQWLPEHMTGLLLAFELWKRFKEDRRLAREAEARRAKAAPAPAATA